MWIPVALILGLVALLGTDRPRLFLIIYSESLVSSWFYAIFTGTLFFHLAWKKERQVIAVHSPFVVCLSDYKELKEGKVALSRTKYPKIPGIETKSQSNFSQPVQNAEITNANITMVQTQPQQYAQAPMQQQYVQQYQNASPNIHAPMVQPMQQPLQNIQQPTVPIASQMIAQYPQQQARTVIQPPTQNNNYQPYPPSNVQFQMQHHGQQPLYPNHGAAVQPPLQGAPYLGQQPQILQPPMQQYNPAQTVNINQVHNVNQTQSIMYISQPVGMIQPQNMQQPYPLSMGQQPPQQQLAQIPPQSPQPQQPQAMQDFEKNKYAYGPAADPNQFAY